MKAVIILLSAILIVAGLGLYSYQREVNRRANERCDNAHSDFQSALAGPDWPFTTTKLEKKLKACGGLTPEEITALQQRREEIRDRAKESICKDDLQRHGRRSAQAMQDCPNTKLGKKAGF